MFEKQNTLDKLMLFIVFILLLVGVPGVARVKLYGNICICISKDFFESEIMFNYRQIHSHEIKLTLCKKRILL